MTNCKFEAIYNNLEEKEIFKRWTCDEKANNSNTFCDFHDKRKSQWDDSTFVRFRTKAQDNIRKGTPLFCIGYHFPNNISFKLLLPLDSDTRQQYSMSDIQLEFATRDTRQRIYDISIYLSDAEFEGQVEFSHCTFRKPLNLSGAVFKREVLFRETIFEGKFYPRNTKFYGNVNFRWAQFGKADFHDTLFNDKANFRQSEFTDSRFRGVKFQDKANFVHTKFHGATEFVDTIFMEANFVHTKFYGDKTEFVGTSFRDAFFSSEVVFDSKTKFKYVVFEIGEKIGFATRNLSNVSFMNTDITRVKFSEDVYWGPQKKLLEDRFKVVDERDREKKVAKYKEKNRFKVVDESDLEKEVAKNGKNVYYSEIDSIKAIYRNLRENYEYRLRYDEAGQFFIREMELKRNYYRDSQGNIKKTDPFRRNFSLTGFYRLASYGEKVRMPFLLMGITIFLSLITYLYNFHPAYYPSLDYDGLAPLGDVTQRSFTTFLQLRNENFIWLDYIYKALGILSLGLLAIPLRRKFERKFRH